MLFASTDTSPDFIRIQRKLTLEMSQKIFALFTLDLRRGLMIKKQKITFNLLTSTQENLGEGGELV